MGSKQKKQENVSWLNKVIIGLRKGNFKVILIKDKSVNRGWKSHRGSEFFNFADSGTKVDTA